MNRKVEAARAWHDRVYTLTRAPIGRPKNHVRPGQLRLVSADSEFRDNFASNLNKGQDAYSSLVKCTMSDPNSTTPCEKQNGIANSLSVGEKKESGLRKFFSKLFGGSKKEKKPETQETAQPATETAPAKSTEEPKVSFSEPEPEQDVGQPKRASGVKDLAPQSRPMSLFIQKGMEDTDDEPLSCTDTSCDEDDDHKKESSKEVK